MQFSDDSMIGAEIEGDGFVQLSVSLYKREVADATWKALKDGNTADRTLMESIQRNLRKEWLDTTQKIRVSPPFRNAADDPWGEVVKTLVRVHENDVEDALCKSAPNFVVKTRYKTDKYAAVPIGKEVKIAREKADLLGMKLGIVSMREGYAARVHKDDVLAAEYSRATLRIQ